MPIIWCWRTPASSAPMSARRQGMSPGAIGWSWTALLYMTDVLERSTQVYLVRQTYLELLAQEDESFSGRFQLPDGTRPFAAEEE